jgi:hypothetical protein
VYWYGSSTHPNEVQVNLYGNDQSTGMSTYAHAPNWEYEIGYLPKYDANGNQIDYIVSVSVEGWDTFVIQTSRTGWDVVLNERADHKTEANTETSQTQPEKVETTTPEATKTSSETIDVSGRVIWNDHDNEEKIRPEAITICLMANGTDVAEKMVTSASDWHYTFEGVAKNDNDGNVINYTLCVDPVDGYRFEYNRYDVMGIHGVKSVKTPGVTQDEPKPEKTPEQPATTQETVKPQEPQQTPKPTTSQTITTTSPQVPQTTTTTMPTRSLPPTGDTTSVVSLATIASGMLAIASGVVKKIIS